MTSDLSSSSVSALTNDDLDELEVELAQVEQSLRLLDDEAVDPDAAIAWLREPVSDPEAAASENLGEPAPTEEPPEPAFESSAAQSVAPAAAVESAPEMPGHWPSDAADEASGSGGPLQGAGDAEGPLAEVVELQAHRDS